MMQVYATPLYPSESMWQVVRRLARRTVKRTDLGSLVSEKFKAEMIASQHSPIREFKVQLDFFNIPTFAAQHMSRHQVATIYGEFLHEDVRSTDREHYVSTQRPDRTGADRGQQDAPVDYSCTANIQGLIDMSKKRLCFLAETPVRGRWGIAKSLIAKVEPLVARTMVPTCVACGFCPEAKYCPQRYSRSEHFKRAVNDFRMLKGFLHEID